MSFEDVVDRKIREAMDRGDFDNLPGRGKPQDHDAYFRLPEDLRMGYTVLRNAGYVPAEVELLKDIEALEARLRAATDEVQRDRLARAIRDKRLTFDVMMERRNHRARPECK